MTDKNEKVDDLIGKALSHRFALGRHAHHRDCIHNLPPEEQAAVRGRTLEQYVALHGAPPVQITPDDWEVESPFGSEAGA